MRKTTAAAPLVGALLLLLTACGGSGTPDGGTPTDTSTGATATTSAGPTTTAAATPTEDILTFTVDGIGPYQLGATLDSLLSDGLLDAVNTGGEICPLNTTARGVELLTDIHMSFRQDGKLYLVSNRSPAISTPSGASLGDTLAELNATYASATHETLGAGAYSAFLVRAGTAGRGILFDLGNDNHVFAMAAGDANYLRDSYLNGTDYC